MINLRNLTRLPIVIPLTEDCICAALPATTVRQRATVKNKRTQRVSVKVHVVSHPPTLTLRAQEILRGLPDAVADAPAVLSLLTAARPTIKVVGCPSRLSARRTATREAPADSMAPLSAPDREADSAAPTRDAAAAVKSRKNSKDK